MIIYACVSATEVCKNLAKKANGKHTNLLASIKRLSKSRCIIHTESSGKRVGLYTECSSGAVACHCIRFKITPCDAVEH